MPAHHELQTVLIEITAGVSVELYKTRAKTSDMSQLSGMRKQELVYTVLFSRTSILSSEQDSRLRLKMAANA